MGANFTEPLREVFNPKEINGTKNEGVIFEKLKEEGVIDDAGKIDFAKLGLSAKEIKKNQLEGKVWVDDNGKFQVKVNGFLGDGCIKAFSALKGKVGSVAQTNELENPITLDPNILGKSSAEDMEVMERGGQIQYHSCGDTNSPRTLKLVLDPGEDGKNDGLTVSVLQSNKGSVKETRRSAKIPLSVVFEGQELDGKKTDHPLLENWRENRYFERSVVKTEWFFDKKTSDNTNSVGRTQAQNDLWKATNEYLRWTLNESESHKGVMAEIICGSDGVRNDETRNDKNDNKEMSILGQTGSNGYIGSSVRIEDIPVIKNSGNLKIKNSKDKDGINKEEKTKPLEQISASTINEVKNGYKEEKVEDSGNKRKPKIGKLKAVARERKEKDRELKEHLKALQEQVGKCKIFLDKLKGEQIEEILTVINNYKDSEKIGKFRSDLDSIIQSLGQK